MGFRFRARERVDIALRRVVREQIRGAIHDLTAPAEDRHEAVHDARKRFKMIRATLRLARGSLGEEVFRAECDAYRDMGRALATVRDAAAVIESLDRLRKRLPADAPEETWIAVRKGLEERLSRVVEDEVGLEARAATVAAALPELLLRVRRWPLRDRGFRTIDRGLGQVYRQGRDRMTLALVVPSDEAFHEWRKRVKDHWYHVRLLRNLWPTVLDAIILELKALSDALGDDHDLAVLVPLLHEQPEAYGGPEAVEAMALAAARRRTQLQDRARDLARRVYAEKPSRRVRWFEAMW